MASNSISTHVTKTVTLGSGGYGETLTLTATANLAPTAPGAYGIIEPASLSGVQITNNGRIIAGSGDASVTGGIGVDLLGAGTLVNHGIIEGGYSGTRGLPLGGVGVFLDRLATLSNTGSIVGGNANYGGLAGVGVYIDGGALTNNGAITGGFGEEDGSTGAAGVQLSAGGTLINTGTIRGGGCGDLDTSDRGAIAGDGVDILSNATLTNNGTILGGFGGNYNFGVGLVGEPGVGVFLATASTMTNNRLIEGGSGGFASIAPGAAGVEMARGGWLINRGTIIGGYGSTPFIFVSGSGISPGGDGVEVVAFGVVSNGGTIFGGAGGQEPAYGGTGGDGVYLHAGTLTNGGLIQGGAGGVYRFGVFGYCEFGNDGGIGVSLASDGTITNNGTVIGGAGSLGEYVGSQGGPAGGVGGIGVDVGQGGTLVNRGVIFGGAGGDALGKHFYPAGDGGIGVYIARLGDTLFVNHGTITGGAAGLQQSAQYSVAGVGGLGAEINTYEASSNSGVITGGAGGAATSSYGPPVGTGGAGGAGVDLAHGTLTNTGAITGGAGGYGLIRGGAGGTGVYLSQATLITSGTITGGAGGNGNIANGAAGDAVELGPDATLLLEAGAVFNGLVAADAGTNDVLKLGGSAAGTVGDFGIDFTNFPTITELAGADWSLDRLNVLAASTTLEVDGLLGVTGTLVANGSVIVGAHGDLVAAAGGGIGIGTELMLAGGTVSGFGAFSVGAGQGVGPGGTISGYGTIANGGSYDDGIVVATGGTLSLQGGFIESTGTTFLIDSKAALQIVIGGSLSDIVFAAGGQARLVIGGALTTLVDATLTGFGTGDVVDLTNLAASVGDFNGGVLAVPDGAYTDALTFAGGITAANLRFTPDGHGGTDVSYVPAAPAARLDASHHSQPQSHFMTDMILDYWHA